jgi:cation diffusion facilitator family transporter
MRTKEDSRVLLYALLLGIVLMVAKFTAWLLTGSNAILTDALESIVNVVAGGIAWYSLWLAAHPADSNHPYGHGKVEFISAGVEGALISFAGLSIIIKSTYNFFHPQQLERLDLGLLITAGSGAVNLLLGWWLRQHGKKRNSLTMAASGQHLMSDAYSSAGLLVGLLAIQLTGLMMLDNVFAIGLGVLIIVIGLRLVRRSLAGIMDEADEPLMAGLVAEMNRGRSHNWIDVHNLRLIRYGAELHLDCHLTLPWYFNTRQSHDEVKAFEALIDRYEGQPVEMFVHVDPCEPPLSCQVCPKQDCAERQAPLVDIVPWTIDNVRENHKHSFHFSPKK